jgi:hypothetical protein
LIIVIVKWSCVTKHTPKALQKDKIWSMTSQKLENDIEEPKSKAQKRARIKGMTVVSLSHHCWGITVASLFHHCLITVFGSRSCVTSRCIITLQMHCKRIKYDQWHHKPLIIFYPFAIPWECVWWRKTIWQ